MKESSPNSPSGIFLNADFDDLDAFLQTVKAWNLQFRQLERGNLKTSLKQYLKPHFQLGYCQMDKHIHQLGVAPKGFWTFAITTGSRVIWKGMEPTAAELIVYRPGAEIKCVSWKGFEVITLSIPETTLESICEEQKLSNVMKTIRENEFIQIDPENRKQLRSFLVGIIDELSRQTGQFNTIGMIDLFDWEIPTKLCQMIDGPGQQQSVISSPARERAMKRVIDYLFTSIGDPVRMVDLCEIAGVSERTLQYAFQERYGMSPTAYLKAHLLNNAHIALSRADPQKVKVVNIAHQWGFWHMGQFAADYKKMFGKRPSETLSKV